jgi:hypothetical protein
MEISFKGASSYCFTAFETVHGLRGQKTPHAASSEYGLNTCRVFEPVVMRP